MLTPNEIRRKKYLISRLSLSSTEGLMLCDLYELVLKEISNGSIDPKSLAMAALEPVKKDS